jgi:hypothetical protein
MSTNLIWLLVFYTQLAVNKIFCEYELRVKENWVTQDYLFWIMHKPRLKKCFWIFKYLNIRFKSSDLGHRRSGAFPHDHDFVLSRRDGHHAGVRHHQRKVLRQHRKVAQKHPRTRQRGIQKANKCFKIKLMWKKYECLK